MQNLNPTLWRTCKMLAGRTRIRMLRQLLEHPGECVSALGKRVAIKESAASQELRRIRQVRLHGDIERVDLARLHAPDVGGGVIDQGARIPQGLDGHLDVREAGQRRALVANGEPRLEAGGRQQQAGDEL